MSGRTRRHVDRRQEPASPRDIMPLEPVGIYPIATRRRRLLIFRVIATLRVHSPILAYRLSYLRVNEHFADLSSFAGTTLLSSTQFINLY
jgi:hypothetical protein